MERPLLDTAPEFFQARQAICYVVAGNQACVDCPHGGADHPIRLNVNQHFARTGLGFGYRVSAIENWRICISPAWRIASARITSGRGSASNQACLSDFETDIPAARPFHGCVGES
jgi:hypothetical protein